MLRTFAKDHPSALLRLVPISSGIYAGAFRAQMAEITAAALRAAVERLAAESPELLKELPPYQDRKCELCLFDPREAAPYAAALKLAIAPSSGDAP